MPPQQPTNMATLNITIDENQLPVFADYYRSEKKKLEAQLDYINKILAKIDGKSGKKGRGRPKKASAAAAAKEVAATGKKRGPKPGSKRGPKPGSKRKAKATTGAKRGPKPKVKTEVSPDANTEN